MKITIELVDADDAPVGKTGLEVDNDTDIPFIVEYRGMYYRRLHYYTEHKYRQTKLRKIINLNKG
jgi:hypothetical protein